MEPQQACRGMYSDRAEVSCMLAVRDVAEQLDHNAVGVCFRNTPDSTAIACLRQVVLVPGKSYDAAALEICDSMTGSSAVNSCVRTVRDAQMFNDRAVPVCADRHSNAAKNRCLRTIRNQIYLEEDVTACSRIYVDAQAIRCLRATGESI